MDSIILKVFSSLDDPVLTEKYFFWGNWLFLLVYKKIISPDTAFIWAQFALQQVLLPLQTRKPSGRTPHNAKPQHSPKILEMSFCTQKKKRFSPFCPCSRCVCQGTVQGKSVMGQGNDESHTVKQRKGKERAKGDARQTRRNLYIQRKKTKHRK